MDELSLVRNKLAFEEELETLYANRTGKPKWSRERIINIMKILEEYNRAPELNKVRNSTHYHYWRHYEVIEDLGQEVLILKRKQPTDPAVKVVPSEEYFEVLTQVHEATGHGGRDKMLHAMKQNCSIPTPIIKIFLNHCDICKYKKANTLKNRCNVRQITEKRGLINFIDKQTEPDGSYKWILVYQDAFTRFYFIRPLKTNEIPEVAFELMKIFLQVGSPDVLVHSDVEFASNILVELNRIGLNSNIICEVPKLQSNCDGIVKLLDKWMDERDSRNWALGIYFVQYQKNTTFDPVIDKTPFRALFSYDARKPVFDNMVIADVKIEVDEVSRDDSCNEGGDAEFKSDFDENVW